MSQNFVAEHCGARLAVKRPVSSVSDILNSFYKVNTNDGRVSHVCIWTPKRCTQRLSLRTLPCSAVLTCFVLGTVTPALAHHPSALIFTVTWSLCELS